MWRRVLTAVVMLAVALGLGGSAASQPARRVGPPKLEPVAETKLLMEGLAKPNFDGLGRSLKDRPADAAGWGFARGQALLIAETGNLLMMRPPKTRTAQDAWMARAADLRDAAAGLARSAADKDYVGARGGVAVVANACNRCHQSFQVPTRVAPLDVGP